jgi:hypothetical protein
LHNHFSKGKAKLEALPEAHLYEVVMEFLKVLAE